MEQPGLSKSIRLDDRSEDLKNAKGFGIFAILGFCVFLLPLLLLNPASLPGNLIVPIGMTILLLGAGGFMYYRFNLLRHSKINATLSITTNHATYQPGDEIRAVVSVDAEEDFQVRQGSVELMYLMSYPQLEGGDDWDISRTESFKMGEGYMVVGNRYETPVKLILPVVARESREPSSDLDYRIEWKLKFELKTVPRSRSTLELEVPVHAKENLPADD
jgi:hypothetical protein